MMQSTLFHRVFGISRIVELTSRIKYKTIRFACSNVIFRPSTILFSWENVPVLFSRSQLWNSARLFFPRLRTWRVHFYFNGTWTLRVTIRKSRSNLSRRQLNNTTVVHEKLYQQRVFPQRFKWQLDFFLFLFFYFFNKRPTEQSHTRDFEK